MIDKSKNEKNILILSLSTICVIFSIPLFFNWFQLYASFEESNFFTSREIGGLDFVKYYNQILLETLAFESPKESDANNAAKELNQLAGRSEFYHNEIFKNLVFGEEVNSQKALFSSYAIETHAYIQNFTSTSRQGLDDDVQEKVADISYKYLKLVGDYSNLILDPELDSYYLSYLTTSQIPLLTTSALKLANHLSNKKRTPINENKREILRLSVEIRSLLEDIQYATIKSAEAANAKGDSAFRFEILEKFDNLRTTLRQALSNIEFRTNYRESVSKDNLASASDLLEMMPKLRTFSASSLTHLNQMLAARLAKTKSKQFSGILLSFSLWAASLCLALFMFFRIWGRRKELGGIIEAQQMSLEANAKMAALGEIAAGIGHEIATPLTIIASSSLHLLQKTDKSAAHYEQIQKSDEKIQRMVKRINQIIRSMKSFVYQNENQEQNTFDVRNIIEDVRLLTHSKALQIGVVLQIESPEYPLYVLGVESELIQAIVNLINNSIDVLEGKKQKEVKLRIFATEEQIKLEVQDSGPGIPKDHQNKIFETLFTTKEAGKGTGLGLSISKKMIEKHRGELVLLDRTPGATFQITLPRAKNPAQA